MPAWQRCQSSLVLIHGAASAGDRLGKVTLFGGNKQLTTKFCFSEDHLGGFQESHVSSIYSSLPKWSKVQS